MKKALLLILGAAVLFGIFAVSCSSDKKKKVTSNTASIIIDPADLSDGIGYSSSVVITGRISTDANATIQQWTISDSVLGTINGSTAAVLNTNSITYATPASGDAAGYIRAHWNGLTKDVKVAIGSCTVSGGGISTGTSSGLILYNDSGLSSELQERPAYYGDWQFYGSGGYDPAKKPVLPYTSKLGNNEDPETPGLYWLPTWEEASGADGDAIKCFKSEFVSGTNYTTNYYAGVALSFKQSKDLSNYDRFVFWAKANVSANILVEVNDKAKQETILIGTSWAAYTITINPAVSVTEAVAFTIQKENQVNSPTNLTLYLDNIHYVKAE